MLQTARKTGSVATATLGSFICYLALAGFVSAAKGNTGDLGVGQAFVISAIALGLAALLAFGAWYLWPRHRPGQHE